MYSLLLALIYIAFISLGLPDSLLGSGWPAMRADLGVPVSFGRNHRFQPVFGFTYEKMRRARGYGRQRAAHRRRSARIFLFR